MPNEQTTVPLFVAAEILTAADMNLSAGTGVPVFATTVTRDAGFGGAGEKVLAEGQLCYLSSTNVVQYYDGAAWATVGPSTGSGLVLVKTQTVGTAVSSVTVTDAFSSTYENYRIVFLGNTASGNNDMAVTLGSTATGYYAGFNYVSYGGGASSSSNSNSASWSFIGSCTVVAPFLNMDVFQPNLAVETFMTFNRVGDTLAGTGGGYVNNSTQYTAFTMTPAGGNTLTGGTVFVYGYAKA